MLPAKASPRCGGSVLWSLVCVNHAYACKRGQPQGLTAPSCLAWTQRPSIDRTCSSWRNSCQATSELPSFVDETTWYEGSSHRGCAFKSREAISVGIHVFQKVISVSDHLTAKLSSLFRFAFDVIHTLAILKHVYHHYYYYYYIFYMYYYLRHRTRKCW